MKDSDSLPFSKTKKYTEEEYFAISDAFEGKLEYYAGYIVEKFGSLEGYPFTQLPKDHSSIERNFLRILLKSIDPTQFQIRSKDNLAVDLQNVESIEGEEFALVPVEVDQSKNWEATMAKAILMVAFHSYQVGKDLIGQMLRQCPQQPNLQTLVLVDKCSPSLRIYTPTSQGRMTMRFSDGPASVVEVDQLGLRFRLSEIYQNVIFEW